MTSSPPPRPGASFRTLLLATIAPLAALSAALGALASGLWLLVVAIGAIGAAIGLSAWLARRIGRERTAGVEAEAGRHLAELEGRVADRTAQLAAANQELESFAYSVSHDLRAPLRAIDGFGKALLEDYADRLDDTGRDFLARVRSASQRMGELIDDLLVLSRAARGELNPAGVDLGDLARRIIDGYLVHHPERAVDLRIEPGVRAVGDPNLLRVVMDNLLSNALKYTGKTEAARIEFGVTDRDGERVYFVRDNGAGYDPAYAGKLFQPFQRLHRADEFEGHGIGLATVRRVIHRHRGRVWAEGQVGRGATFYFTLGTDREGGGLPF